MRRWVLLFLMLVVPIQVVWGVAAPYCAHESSTTSKKHFGHHEHRHQVAGDDAQHAHDDSAASKASNHVDCGSCHLGCSVTLSTPTIKVDLPAREAILNIDDAYFASHVPSGPERPDRASHTSAARFSGGIGSTTT
jgi:hypothetical protein